MSPAGPHTRTLRPPPPAPESRAHGLFVLACFSRRRRVLTAEQIAAQLKLLPETVKQLAVNLVLVHCLEQDAPGTYRLAPSLTVNDER